MRTIEIESKAKSREQKVTTVRADNTLLLYAGKNTAILPGEICLIEINAKMIKGDGVIMYKKAGVLEEMPDVNILKNITPISKDDKLSLVVAVPRNKYSLSSAKQIMKGALIATATFIQLVPNEVEIKII